MWHFSPDQKITVSVKRNPGQRTHEDCLDDGYINNIKPRVSAFSQPVSPDQPHTEMLSFIDGQPKKQKLSCIHSPEKDLAEEQSLVCPAIYSCTPHEAREGSMSVLIVADRRSLQEQ
jgi:hypothetical protein